MDTVQRKGLHNTEKESQGLILNSTMASFHMVVNDIRERLKMLCWVLDCEEPLEESSFHPSKWKKELDLNPRQLLRDFYRDTYLQNKNNRTKKSIIDTGIALGSFGLSLYTLTEVKSLHNELFEEENNIGHMATILNHNSLQLKTDSQEITKITKQITKVCEFTSRTQFELDKQLAIEYLNIFATQFDHYCSGLESMITNQKITFRFFDLHHVTTALTSIKNRAAKNNLKLINDHPSSILKESLSYISQEGKISFILHLTLIDQNLIQVYKFLPTPIKLSEGRYVKPKIEDKIFAVSNTKNKAYILSESILAMCTKKNMIFSCPNSIELRDPKRSCLGALFESQIEYIKAYCRMEEYEINEEVILPIDNNKFLSLIPSRHKITAEVSCPIADQQGKMSPLSPVLLSGLEEVTLPQGCVLNSGKFTVTTPKKYEIRQTFLTRKLNGIDEYFEKLLFKEKGVNILKDEYIPYQAPPLFIPTRHDKNNVTWIKVVCIIMIVLIIAAPVAYLGRILFLQRLRRHRLQQGRSDSPRQRLHQGRGDSPHRRLDDFHVPQRDRRVQRERYDRLLREGLRARAKRLRGGAPESHSTSRTHSIGGKGNNEISAELGEEGRFMGTGGPITVSGDPDQRTRSSLGSISSSDENHSPQRSEHGEEVARQAREEAGQVEKGESGKVRGRILSSIANHLLCSVNTVSEQANLGDLQPQGGDGRQRDSQSPMEDVLTPHREPVGVDGGEA